MELTQIQVEAIDAAGREGPVDPGSCAPILLLDVPATAEAFAALKQRGLVRQDDVGCFSLTEDGEALQRRWESQKSAAVKRRTATWQPR
jgi:Mn-dependent DtxR family transcriptional regulator